jgi:DNA-binding transcriptional MocR family regulator
MTLTLPPAQFIARWPSDTQAMDQITDEFLIQFREAAAELRISPATASRALKSLQHNGFIVAETRGAFSLKKRHATEWRLTEFPCDVTHALPTKDFMRWQPSQKIQKTVPVVKLSVPVAKPNGTHGETDVAEKQRDGICSETVRANFQDSQFHQRHTTSLPGYSAADQQRDIEQVPNNAHPKTKLD